MLQQPDGLGIVIAVRQTLVNGETQIQRLLHGHGAVRGVDGPHGLLPDDAEQGAGTPVGQVVIAALELDGAQIGDDHGAVIGVRGDDVRRHPTVLIQPHEEVDGGLADEAGDPVEDIHGPSGGVYLVRPALRHLTADVVVDVGECVLVLAVQEGQRLGTLIGELLLHHEGGGYLVALIEVAVDDEAVQLGAQGDGFHQGCQHQVEHGIGKLRLRLILLGDIGVHVGQVDALGDVGLIVASVGVEDAGDVVQGVQLPHQAAVLAVAPALFLCFH